MTGSDTVFRAVIDRAYRETREKFVEWSDKPAYHKYVVPPSTDPDVGFAIFYTAPAFRPKLLVIGQNPSNFAGVGRDLTDSPNAKMLGGEPPVQSSYDLHDHLFGVALREALSDFPALHSGCVGMNVWYYQCISGASAAPKPLRQYCENTTRRIEWVMAPRAVLCLGRPAFDALRGTHLGEKVLGTHEALVCRRGSTSYWFVWHPTGSWSAAIAQHDLPIVLRAIEIADNP